MKILSKIIALLIFSCSMAANAASITYTSWSESGSDTVIPVFTVSDDPDGMFRVDISIDTINSPNDFAKVTGVFFNLGNNNISIVESDITGETAAGVLQGHTDFAIDANKINGTTLLGISGVGVFDVALGYKSGDDKIELPMSFYVNDYDGALTLSDWGDVAIRFQVVGIDGFGEGSDKETSSTPTFDNISEVPVPAAVWLFGSAFIGLMGAAKKRTKAV